MIRFSRLFRTQKIPDRVSEGTEMREGACEEGEGDGFTF